jgi:hypothetical protein
MIWLMNASKKIMTRAGGLNYYRERMGSGLEKGKMDEMERYVILESNHGQGLAWQQSREALCHVSAGCSSSLKNSQISFFKA